MTELTQEQIAMAADPDLAMAAFKGDEAEMLRTILAVMCLDAECKELFEEVWTQGYGLSSYSLDDNAIDHAEERLRQLHQRIEADSARLRLRLQEEMELHAAIEGAD
jgi:hypothetical protein